jgi:mono/diheme cytochrome c family protein
VGTRFWKEFSLDGRKIETRLSWRASEAGWVFASYAWNDGGTDAVLVPDDGLPAVTDIAPGRRHSIPSRTDCTACHGSDGNPLGFNALQLSPDRDPNAVHGEPLPPGAVTLKELVEDRLFSPVRTDLVASPPRIRTANPETRAVLGYLAANCAMCHNGSGTIAAPGPVIRYDDLLRDGDAVARTLLRQPTRWQVPGAAEGDSMLVNPGSPDSSAILVRMRSRAPSSQMPPLGTVVRDQEAVEAIARWIKGDLARLHPSHSW